MPLLPMLLAQAALLGVEPLADPMAGVTPDWILCTHPDDEAKTCVLMATFVKVGDGQYSELDRSQVAGLPGLVLDIPSSAYLKHGMLCSVPRRGDFAQARIVRHADGATPQREAAVLKQIGYMVPVEGKEVCGQFYPDGVGFQVKALINGKPVDGMVTPARWVGKDDGYTVVGWQGVVTATMTGAR